MAFVAAVAAVSAPLAGSSARAATTVTTYQYNADGALTAVTTRTGVANATTTYLTWDNFVPDIDDPTTGTVYAGNGNLLAIGPKPGTGSSLFAFDNRDRLTGFSGADKSAAYGYHADGLMASSAAADNSGFGFYYSGSSMANLHQTDTDQWSARLGPVRYLDDGSEEVLLTPRKDVAATYDPSSNTVASYDYDSFGAEEGAPLSSSYDLKDNPHRYAGAYRDPLWGGYYLKARWYDPDLAIFLSRDPLAGFHPYSYSDGSPVMNVDPSGTSAQTSGHVAGETNVGGVLFNMFVAPLISIFTKEYWNDVIHNRDMAGVFLAAGIVSEASFVELDILAVSAGWRGLSAATRWAAQDAVDVGLNVGQAAASATHGGRFDANAFGQNLEGLPMGMFYARGLVGFGRRTHTLRGADIAKRISALKDDTVLIYRARLVNAGKHGWSSPVMEAGKIGYYHDELIAVSGEYFGRNNLVFSNIEGEKYAYVKGGYKPVRSPGFRSDLMNIPKRYEFLGEIKTGTYGQAHEKFFKVLSGSNPNNHYLAHDFSITDSGKILVAERYGVSQYSYFTNSCHGHLEAVVKELRRGPFQMQE